jgi:hypothetical protein
MSHHMLPVSSMALSVPENTTAADFGLQRLVQGRQKGEKCGGEGDAAMGVLHNRKS